MGCYYHYCPRQEARLFATDTVIERGVKKKQQDEMRRLHTTKELPNC